MQKSGNQEFHCHGCGQLLLRHRIEWDQKNACNVVVLEVKCKRQDCYSANSVRIPVLEKLAVK